MQGATDGEATARGTLEGFEAAMEGHSRVGGEGGPSSVVPTVAERRGRGGSSGRRQRRPRRF